MTWQHKYCGCTVCVNIFVCSYLCISVWILYIYACPVYVTLCVGVIACVVVTLSDRAFVFVCTCMQQCVSLHVFISFVCVCVSFCTCVSVRDRKGRITCLLLRDRVGLPGETNRGRRRAKAGGVTGAEIEKQRGRWCDSEWEEVTLEKRGGGGSSKLETRRDGEAKGRKTRRLRKGQVHTVCGYYRYQDAG